MDTYIVQIGYGACAVAFLALLVLAGLSRSRSDKTLILLFVAGANFLWALAISISSVFDLPSWLLLVLEVARLASWLVLSIDLLGLLRWNQSASNHLRFLGVVLPASAGCYVFARPMLKQYAGLGWLPSDGVLWMIIPVVGLLLVENIVRNANRDTLWALKHLCLAMGVIYVYELFYFADAMLSGRLNPTLYAVRGFIGAMIVPLVAIGVVRSDTWPVAIHVSRQVVFHSLVLIASGLYLLAMAVTGQYLGQLKGEWGTVLQTLFLIGAGLILVVIFSSGSLRARAKLFIGRNFFSLKYDYRETWLRFIRALSSGDPNSGLHQRLMESISELMESTGAGLWILGHDDTTYVPVASWNLGEGLPALPVGSTLEQWLREHQSVIELAEAADPERYPGLQVPDWLRTQPNFWLIVPLVHRETLQGIMILRKPRIQRQLDWEDHELLLSIGQQAASYLAEERSLKALSDARQLEEFGRRFSFVAHDLKNIVGQLSLLLRNVERFKDNEDFRHDMIETVAHSVDRMSSLLQRLQMASDGCTAADDDLADLEQLIAEIAAAWKRTRPGFVFDLQPMPGASPVPKDILRSVMEHLLQNAFDAAGSDGNVILRTRVTSGIAVIEIEDDGDGMNTDFVQNELFQPFHSTSDGGFGIGAYQTRHHVRSLGGRLEVQTAPGKGTTMQVLLPLVATSGDKADMLQHEVTAS